VTQLEPTATAKRLELLIIQREKQIALPAKDPEIGLDHLKWMCREVYNERVQGEMAREWLGYVKGAIRAAGGATFGEIVGVSQPGCHQDDC
jgi:hypothetical protein